LRKGQNETFENRYTRNQRCGTGALKCSERDLVKVIDQKLDIIATVIAKKDEFAGMKDKKFLKTSGNQVK